MRIKSITSYFFLSGLLALFAFASANSLADQCLLSGEDLVGQTLYAEIYVENGVHITEGLGLEGHEDEIRIKAVATAINNSYKAKTGAIKGPTVRNPVQIIKTLDAVTPLLFSEAIQQTSEIVVIVKLWKPNDEGQHEHYFTVALEDAAIATIETSADGSGYETVSFIFGKMRLTDELSGVEVTIGWTAPPA